MMLHSRPRSLMKLVLRKQAQRSGSDPVSPVQEAPVGPRSRPVLRERFHEDQRQARRYQRLDPAPRARESTSCLYDAFSDLILVVVSARSHQQDHAHRSRRWTPSSRQRRHQAFDRCHGRFHQRRQQQLQALCAVCIRRLVYRR